MHKKTKEQLVTEAGYKPVQIFLQIDGFTGWWDDDAFPGDSDGDSVLFSVQDDLRACGVSLAVRVQIHADAKREDVKRLLSKMLAGVDYALDFRDTEMVERRNSSISREHDRNLPN